MTRPVGILRQESRNRRPSPSDRFMSDDPHAEAIIKLLRRVGEEIQPEATALVEALRQISLAVVNEDLAKVVNSYLRSRRSRIISYDNFFRALNEFRNKLWNGNTVPNAAWKVRTETEQCTPEEFETFDAVIELIGRIAEYDEAARIHIADNPDWNHPLLIMVSLVGCAIPTTMKAAILRTLASFAQSAGSASVIWQYISPAISALTVTGPKQGLKLEIEDIEVKYREYPVTKGVIALMLRIFENLIVSTTAVDLFSVFQEFVHYIYDSVFLKADGRSYVSPQEHLDVICSCLNLFESCLRALNHLSFTTPIIPTVHPGYLLRQRILSGGPFFQKLMEWITICVEELAKSHSEIVTKKLEEVVLIISKIFHELVHRHDEFFALLKHGEKDATVTTLDALISNTINIRTARKDLLFVFMRLLEYRKKSIPLTKNALNVIEFTCRRREDHRDWISILYFDEELYRRMMKSVAECMDMDPEDAQQANRPLESTDSVELVKQTARTVLGLLKQCSFPNLAHIMLGFPFRNGGTVANALGEEARAGLLSRVLQIVEPGLVTFELLPTVTEICLDVIDALTSKPVTSQSVFLFLRSGSTDFDLQKMLNQLPLVRSDDVESVRFLRHQKAILNIVSREIKTLIDSSMIQSAIGHIATLCDLKTTPVASQMLSRYPTSLAAEPNAEKSMLLQLMDVFNVSIPQLEPLRNLNFQYLETANVENALNASVITTDDGFVLHDSTVTLNYLNDHLHMYEDNLAGRNDYIEDFRILCEYIEREAALVGLTRSRRECVESWCQLVNVLIEDTPSESFPFPTVPSFFLQMATSLSEKLLTGVVSEDMQVLSRMLDGIVSAVIKFTSPVVGQEDEKSGADGYAVECLKLTFKSRLLENRQKEFQNLIRTECDLILSTSGLVYDRQTYYASFLKLVRFVEWPFEHIRGDLSEGIVDVDELTTTVRALFVSAVGHRMDHLIRQIFEDQGVLTGQSEAVAVQLLAKLHRLCGQHVELAGLMARSIIPQVVASLARDNQALKACIESQTDLNGTLPAFETKMDVLVKWISAPESFGMESPTASTTMHSCLKTVSKFDVLNSMPLIRHTGVGFDVLQKALISGTNLTIYSYCNRIFRRIIDFLIEILARVQKSNQEAFIRIFKLIQNFGAIISDNLREPTSSDDPAWDDICRTVRLVALLNPSSISKSLPPGTFVDIAPEIMVIELKVGRLLHRISSLLVRPPKGNFRDYRFEMQQRQRSVKLANDLAVYMKALVFDGDETKVNLATIRPVFTKAFGSGAAEYTKGLVSLTYGDLLEEIRAFISLISGRIRALVDIQNASARTTERISETDLRLVLDSDSIPNGRQNQETLYKLFLKEQEIDVQLEIIQLASTLEILLAVFVGHLERHYRQTVLDSRKVSATSLPISMRRALLPILAQERPGLLEDESNDFMAAVRESVTDKFMDSAKALYMELGKDIGGRIGSHLERLSVIVQDAKRPIGKEINGASPRITVNF